MITPKAKLRKEKEVRIGQGLNSTRWNGLYFFILVKYPASAHPLISKAIIK